MAINLAPLSTATTAAAALSNLILATPQDQLGYQPQNAPEDGGSVQNAQTPPSFLFHYEGEQTVTLDSDITDHYVEDNIASQDHIALRPEVVTTHGFVGELNDIPPPALRLVKQAVDKLAIISAYAPQASITAQQSYNEAFQLYQVRQNAENAAVAAWSSINSIFSPGEPAAQNKQQQAFSKFYGYWYNRTLFTVQTPWGVLTDMAIKTLRAVQDDTTRTVTDFELSFKKIRTAITRTVAPTTKAGRAVSQSSSLDDQGTSAPVSSIGLNAGLVQMGVA